MFYRHEPFESRPLSISWSLGVIVKKSVIQQFTDLPGGSTIHYTTTHTPDRQTAFYILAMFFEIG